MVFPVIQDVSYLSYSPSYDINCYAEIVALSVTSISLASLALFSPRTQFSMVSNQRGIHDDDVDDLESGRVVGRRLAGRIVRSDE